MSLCIEPVYNRGVAISTISPLTERRSKLCYYVPSVQPLNPIIIPLDSGLSSFSACGLPPLFSSPAALAAIHRNVAGRNVVLVTVSKGSRRCVNPARPPLDLNVVPRRGFIVGNNSGQALSGSGLRSVSRPLLVVAENLPQSEPAQNLPHPAGVRDFCLNLL